MTGRPKGVIGIKTAGGAIVPVLDFGTQKWNQTVFTTIGDRQSRALFDFYYREEGSGGWLYLDSLPLDHIPPARAGEPELSVTTRLDGQGNLCLQIHDPTASEPTRFVLPAEILSRMGGKPAEEKVPVVKRPGPPAQNAAPVEDSGLPPSGSPGQAQAPVGERGTKSRAGWVVLALLAVFVVVSVLLLDFNPASLLRRGEGRTSGTEKARPADRRTNSTEEAAAGDTARTGGEHQPGKIILEQADSPLPAGTPVGRAEQPAAEKAAKAGEEKKAPPVQESEPREEGGAGFIPESRQYAERARRKLESPSTLGNGDNREYQIIWGDTLWRITERFYGDREIYPSLADANRLSDPDVIIAGETLVLPPLLEQERRSGSEK